MLAPAPAPALRTMPRALPSEPQAPRRPPSSAHIKEALVDLIDDLEMPGQQRLQEVHRPALQGLGQDRVVGVGAGLHRHFPCLAEE